MRLKAKWIILFGTVFVAAGLGLFVFTKISASKLQKQTNEILNKTKAAMPELSVGSVDEYSLMQMRVIEIIGEDIIGIIEFENMNVTLPIGNNWNNEDEKFYPKRLGGTVYDNSLVIGGCDMKGQFEILKEIDQGYKITVTDMTGAQFRYEVKDIIRKKSANADSFKEDNADLSLFVKDSQSSDFIIVRCLNVNSN